MCCVVYKCYTNRVRFVRWLPVIAEILLMLWTYYVYVVCLCYFSSAVPLETAVLLIVYHVLLGVTLWCHCMSITAVPMVPPQQFHYDDAQWNKLNNDFLWIQRREEMENLRLRLGIKTIQASMGRGLLVYCQQCRLIKPDRCHHCSKCGVCVLKMDHHCPWINNCVGFHNYKYFLLFVVYCLVYCIFVPLTSLRFVVAFFVDVYNEVDVSGDYKRIQIIVMFLFLVITGMALVPLLKLHWSLVCMNITTLENTRPVGLVGKAPDMRLFDIGLTQNLCQIFGHRKVLWFFPVFTSVGDGTHFPLRDEFVLEDKGNDFNKNRDEFVLEDKANDFNKNRDELLLDKANGFSKTREETAKDSNNDHNNTESVLKRNSNDMSTESVPGRDGIDNNRTENSDYFYQTGH